jgi:3-oxoacyl-[acyl-carrier protein] reductase
MDLGLQDKVAFVAAASQGLGRAVADELAAEGASLVICSRDQKKLDRVAHEIESKSGTRVAAIAADLSVTKDIENAIAHGIERFGQIDILVTNNGGPPAGKFDSLSPKSWDDAYHGLLTSVLEMTRLVLPGMKERRWGRILNVTSIAAKQPVENLMLSNSLRAAVTGFAKTLVDEVAEFGITVNNILPGYTLTERVEELSRSIAVKEGVEIADVRKRWETQIPMRRLGRPEEFGALAAFLVSERASYITGSSVAVDGGWIKSLF